MSIKLLKEIEPDFKTIPVIVSCKSCEMTMWGNSDNAFVVKDGSIICRDCLTPEEEKEILSPHPLTNDR